MNELLQKFRAQYPEYGDMSDTELAQALHGKFYADMSFPEFADKIGLDPKAEATQAAEMRLASGGNSVTDFLHMAAEGATLGQADKLVGAGAAVGNALFPAAFPGSYGASQQKFQQRTDDLQQLAPGAARAAGGAGAVMTLAPALNAIRAARGAKAGAGLGLVGPMGTPVQSAVQAAGTGGRSAMTALKALAGSPWVRGSGLLGALEILRR